MKTAKYLIAAALLALAAGCSPKASEIKPTKNVIVMITDGTSTSLLSVARWYKRYVTDTMDLALNIDPYICGLVQTNESHSPITGSAPSMSAYMTGVRSRPLNLSIYPEPSDHDFFPQDSAKAWSPAATVMEAARLWKGKATGVVSTVVFCHATPAATCTHAGTRSLPRLAKQMASQDLRVMFGGGTATLTPEVRAMVATSGATLLEDDPEGFRSFDGDKLWAVFGPSYMDFEIDRDPAVQPSLAEMTDKAIKILSKDPDGFFLMVEGSKVDYGAHSNDVPETVGDFLAFDKAIKVAIDFAKRDKNTTVVIMPDHGNSAITIGHYGFEDYENASLETIFGGLKNCKASTTKMTQLLQNCKESEISAVFKEWSGIGLTADELSSIKKSLNYTESDYMKVSNSRNLQKEIVKIYNSRVHIGFVSGDHTAEDVFMAVYNPRGQRPQGVITNVQMNAYLCSLVGLDRPLSDLTAEIFAPADEVFAGAALTLDPNNSDPWLTVKKDEVTVRIPGWHNVVYIDRADHTDSLYTRMPSIYMRQNRKFYVDRSLGDLLK